MSVLNDRMKDSMLPLWIAIEIYYYYYYYFYFYYFYYYYDRCCCYYYYFWIARPQICLRIPQPMQLGTSECWMLEIGSAVWWLCYIWTLIDYEAEQRMQRCEPQGSCVWRRHLSVAVNGAEWDECGSGVFDGDVGARADLILWRMHAKNWTISRIYDSSKIILSQSALQTCQHNLCWCWCCL